ncbi:uncharacterized protein BDV14DRAFT_202501 [Aspergillus stella-maris]|uniref:uncharacterized protein n=1 Tax=Aspergillus stella-maris TaxID=1810926 RepID=UPI003CCE1890
MEKVQGQSYGIGVLINLYLRSTEHDGRAVVETASAVGMDLSEVHYEVFHANSSGDPFAAEVEIEEQEKQPILHVEAHQTDVALIVVPLPVVVGLNMPTVQKVGLFFMFVIGCATVITSVIRLFTLFPFLRTQDKTYQISWTDVWINVEVNSIMICACLHFLRHFLRRYAPKLRGEGSSTQKYFKSYGAYGAGGPSTTRSWRRRHSILQDVIELAEHGSGVRIVKEVQWDVTEERRDAASRSGDSGEVKIENQRFFAPGV